MPGIKGIPGACRLFFTSFDCNGPPHVHVERESATCKFWLQSIGLAPEVLEPRVDRNEPLKVA